MVTAAAACPQQDAVAVRQPAPGQVEVSLHLPGVTSALGIDADVIDGQTLLICVAPPSCSTLGQSDCERRITLPFAVDTGTCRVTFKKKTSCLTFAASAAAAPAPEESGTAPVATASGSPARGPGAALPHANGNGQGDAAQTFSHDPAYAPQASLAALTGAANGNGGNHTQRSALHASPDTHAAAACSGGAAHPPAAAPTAPAEASGGTATPRHGTTTATTISAVTAVVPGAPGAPPPLSPSASPASPSPKPSPTGRSAASFAGSASPPRSPGDESLDDATLYRGFFEEPERRPLVGATAPSPAAATAAVAAAPTAADAAEQEPSVAVAGCSGSACGSATGADVTGAPGPGAGLPGGTTCCNGSHANGTAGASPAPHAAPAPHPPQASGQEAGTPGCNGAGIGAALAAVASGCSDNSDVPSVPKVAAPIDCRYLSLAYNLALKAQLSGRGGPSAAAQQASERRVSELLDRVAATLEQYGYCVCDNYISKELVEAARCELAPLEPHYSPGMIWVGKEAERGAQINVSDVRGDVVLWLDPAALGATHFIKDGVKRECGFLSLMQLLVYVDNLVLIELRRRLGQLASLHKRSDAMMAIYPGRGARFAKHVDNTTKDGRRVTAVTYLNPSWSPEQGGALRLFPLRVDTTPVDVLPLCGRVALFYSHEVAHEVMPSWSVRHAITLWYYDADEHAEALAAAKAVSSKGRSKAAQAAARGLLKDLLADGAASSIEATPEGCRRLALRVAGLGDGALEVVAAVMGAPSGAELSETFKTLTPPKLQELRESLRNMGLDSQHHAPDTTVHV